MNTANSEQVYRTVDKFDRAHGTLLGLPDVTHTSEATVTTHEPMIGASQTFILQSFRQADRSKEGGQSKDTLFLQYIDGDAHVRLVVPHRAIQVIIRQHDALTTKVRKRAAKEQAAQRKARGELPGFMKKRKPQE